MADWQQMVRTHLATRPAALVMVVLMSLSVVQSGRAQQRVTAQLSAEVDSQSVTRAFLDSVRAAPKQWAESGDSLMVSRRRGDKQMTYSKLRQVLINGPGVAPSAANRVYISYRFELSGGGVEETITGLQYVYRPPGGNVEEVDLFYVAVEGKAWGQRFLEEKQDLSSSKVADAPFRRALSFLRRIENGADLQHVDGNAVTKTEETAFVEKIRRAASE